MSHQVTFSKRYTANQLIYIGNIGVCVCGCVFRDALLKMREVYERSPQMGDAASLEPRLEEVKQSLQKLEDELRRNQVHTNTTQSAGHTHTQNTHSDVVVC